MKLKTKYNINNVYIINISCSFYIYLHILTFFTNIYYRTQHPYS